MTGTFCKIVFRGEDWIFYAAGDEYERILSARRTGDTFIEVRDPTGGRLAFDPTDILVMQPSNETAMRQYAEWTKRHNALVDELYPDTPEWAA